MKPTIQRVVEAARATGLEIAPTEFPGGTRTAEDAARAVGCGVEQIVKSLVFVADAGAAVALVSGRHRLDPGKLAAALGASGARRATPEEARAATGFAIGGTPPFGHRRRLPVVLDRTLLEHEVVWCAAGTPDSVFPLDPNALLRATGAFVADLAEASGNPTGAV